MTEQEIKKGLAGVVVDTTEISKVVQETNSLTYRGYPVQELAANCSFEEVAYLIWNGELPNAEQLAEFTKRERSQRDIDPKLVDLILGLPKDTHPMHVVQTAVAYLGAVDPQAEDNSPEADRAKAERLYAQLPTVVAIDHRRRHGLDPIAPKEDLTYAENFFHMVFGEVPAKEVVRCFDISLILYAEHSFNASTFTARVITSTTSDMHSSVAGAIGALKGALHGGANEAVMATLAEVGTADKAKEYIDNALANKQKIMGFGHRVYKNYDPRAAIVKDTAHEILEHLGGDDLLDLAVKLEEIALNDDYFIQRKLYPNVDFYTGLIYRAMGFPTDFFTVLFAIGRLPGWIAQYREQLEMNTKINRPRQIYTGEVERKVVPRDQR